MNTRDIVSPYLVPRPRGRPPRKTAVLASTAITTQVVSETGMIAAGRVIGIGPFSHDWHPVPAPPLPIETKTSASVPQVRPPSASASAALAPITMSVSASSAPASVSASMPPSTAPSSTSAPAPILAPATSAPVSASVPPSIAPSSTSAPASVLAPASVPAAPLEPSVSLRDASIYTTEAMDDDHTSVSSDTDADMPDVPMVSKDSSVVANQPNNSANSSEPRNTNGAQPTKESSTKQTDIRPADAKEWNATHQLNGKEPARHTVAPLLPAAPSKPSETMPWFRGNGTQRELGLDHMFDDIPVSHKRDSWNLHPRQESAPKKTKTARCVAEQVLLSSSSGTSSSSSASSANVPAAKPSVASTSDQIAPKKPCFEPTVPKKVISSAPKPSNCLLKCAICYRLLVNAFLIRPCCHRVCDVCSFDFRAFSDADRKSGACVTPANMCGACNELIQIIHPDYTFRDLVALLSRYREDGAFPRYVLDGTVDGLLDNARLISTYISTRWVASAEFEQLMRGCKEGRVVVNTRFTSTNNSTGMTTANVDATEMTAAKVIAMRLRLGRLDDEIWCGSVWDEVSVIKLKASTQFKQDSAVALYAKGGKHTVKRTAVIDVCGERFVILVGDVNHKKLRGFVAPPSIIDDINKRKYDPSFSLVRRIAGVSPDSDDW